MFKQIFENKIGEKLNTFNNSGKVAFEWMDKFRQSLDITEKLQQFNLNDNNNNNVNGVNYNGNTNQTPQANQTKPNSTTTQSSVSGTSASNNQTNNNTNSKKNGFNQNNITNNNNSSNLTNGNNSGPIQNRKSQQNENANHHNSNNKESMESSEYSIYENKQQQYTNQQQYSEDNTFYNNNEYENYNNANHNNINNTLSVGSVQSPKNSFKINNKKLTNQTSLLSFNSSHLSSSNDVETASISSSLSQKSEQQTNPQQQQQQQQNNNTNHHHLNQSKSVVEEKMEDPEYKAAKTASNQNRSLVRQSTDLTSSFPLKPFQKINSETVEIPGLNVKVVRYRIENDLGKLEPHLYKNYNSGGGDNTQMVSKGKIWFSLHYNEEIQSLSVTINRSEIFNGSQSPNGSLSSYSNSASLNANTSVSAPNSPNLNKPDTYVRVQLLPDKKKKYQTRIQRKTCTPVFEETFYFQVPFNELVTKTLYLAQLEFGRFSKHELIGAVRLADLNTIKDLTTGDIEFIRNLTPLANDDLELGELTLTLCYLPAAGRLTVTVVKAINLKSMDLNGKSDPYVKVTLVSRGKRIKKKKTSVMKNTLHPVYNESMLFDIPQDQVEQVDMVVKVIDYDRVGSNELIGCIGIGPSFSGIGRDHWYRMLENPRKPMTQSYYLRDASFLREGLPAKISSALNSDRQESIDSRSS